MQNPRWRPRWRLADTSFKVKYDFFEQIKVGTRVIPQFDVISTDKSIYRTIFMIQCQLQGQKVNSKVKN